MDDAAAGIEGGAVSEIRKCAHDICDRIAEAQAILHDHSGCGRYTPAEVVAKLDALFNEEGLLRAMHTAGYFPQDTPPPVTVAGN
jgi:hypothetical protein